MKALRMNKKRTGVTCLRVSVAAALLLFLALSPAYLLQASGRQTDGEDYDNDTPRWRGVLRVWHVAGFKTHTGSVTAYLESCAAQLEKARPGVYIEVTGMTADNAEEKLSRGERPDIWSLPLGSDAGRFAGLLPAGVEEPTYAGNLRSMRANGAACALPYLYSGYYFIGNTALIQKMGLTPPDGSVDAGTDICEDTAFIENLRAAMQSNATSRYGALYAPPLLAARLGLTGKLALESDFMAGRVPFMIGDAGACGKLTRRKDACDFAIEVRPFGKFTDQVQYIAADRDADGMRARYAGEFITLLLSREAQAKVTLLGAAPAVLTTGGQTLPCTTAPETPQPDLYAILRETLLLEAISAVDSGETALFDKYMRAVLGRE
ncbi:MAG: hypothetical protein LBS18_02350 [Clostridiales bacterium]|jgi:hypothetical protein|nr:hypothetical protein [Clostridiales bacterium]